MNQRGVQLGDLVREMRKNKHLTQEALAERVGVCKRTIIDIESNTGNPQFQILFALVRELNLPVFSLFYPEKEGKSRVESMLLQELGSCSENEIRIILSLVRSLRRILREEEERQRQEEDPPGQSGEICRPTKY